MQIPSTLLQAVKLTFFFLYFNIFTDISQQLQSDLKQRLETKVAENQKLHEENVTLKHEISKLNNTSNSATKQLTEMDDRIAFLERRLVELTERNGLLVHALDESTKSAASKEKKYQEQIDTMQEMGRINDFHKSRIVQPVQPSVKDTFMSLFTPRVSLKIKSCVMSFF